MSRFGAVIVRRNTLNVMCLCSSTKTHYVQFSLHTQQPYWSWNDLHCCSAPLSENVGMFQCDYSTGVIYIYIYMWIKCCKIRMIKKLLMTLFFSNLQMAK